MRADPTGHSDCGLSMCEHEVGLLRIREGVLVGLDEVFEGLGGSEHVFVGVSGLVSGGAGGVWQLHPLGRVVPRGAPSGS